MLLIAVLEVFDAVNCGFLIVCDTHCIILGWLVGVLRFFLGVVGWLVFVCVVYCLGGGFSVVGYGGVGASVGRFWCVVLFVGVFVCGLFRA